MEFRIWWMNTRTTKKERWWDTYCTELIRNREKASRIVDEETARDFAEDFAERWNKEHHQALHRRVLDVEVVEEDE